MHPIESALRKVGWAAKHLDALDNLSQRFQGANPYGVTCELDRTRAHYECRLVATFPPFIEYGREIGEFAYQLRSALDQIIFALSVLPTELNTRDHESAERTPMFRISTVENESLLRGGLKFVPVGVVEAVWQALDSVQPYKLADAAELHPLALLDEINIRDKHRILNPTTAILRVNKEGIALDIEISGGQASDGDVFARVPAHLVPAKDLLPRLSFEELVRVNRPVGGIGIRSLRPIHNYVRNEVVPAFAGFFPPLPSTLSL